MRLTDLNPKWVAEEGRSGQALLFQCPHCKKAYLFVAVANPLDGGSPMQLHKYDILYPILEKAFGGSDKIPTVIPPGVHWTRIGESFENVSITPSVDASASRHWHGYVTDGSIVGGEILQ